MVCPVRFVLPDVADAALLSSQFGSAPDLDVLNPGQRQIVEATLICLEAISRAKAHSVVAMEYEAKRFPTKIAPRWFRGWRTPSLEFHEYPHVPAYTTNADSPQAPFPLCERQMQQRCAFIPSLARLSHLSENTATKLNC
jgi:hypothetical protein